MRPVSFTNLMGATITNIDYAINMDVILVTAAGATYLLSGGQLIEMVEGVNE